jgi:Transposase domain (DUF772)
MKPRVKPQESGSEERFRSKLKNIINLGHELVRLSELIDWSRLETHFASYDSEVGRPGVPVRLVVGLHLLKHIEGLSDEGVCARWERDPYMQYFCGEEYFQHRFPMERFGYDALSPAHRRKSIGGVAAGNVGGSVSCRGPEPQGHRSGGGGHHGTGESHRPSHRTRVIARFFLRAVLTASTV